ANVGLTLDSDQTPELFGEDQARYLVACNFDQAEALMGEAAKAGVPIAFVGKFGGEDVTIGHSSAPLAELKALSESVFPALFS
ncbi:MAG: phosphoribosylformylglycinamidine synthase II, partial [Planktotalea sp.]